MTDDDVPITHGRPYRGRKPELYERALALRREGCPVGEIAERLRVSKSTAYLWTRHLPLDPELVRRRRRAASRARADAQWDGYRAGSSTVIRCWWQSFCGSSTRSVCHRPTGEVPGEHPRNRRRVGCRHGLSRLPDYLRCQVEPNYWKIEGIMKGMADEDQPRDR
ncbi:hypothetical protein ABZ570_07365 [Micromonospora sp. NPDC007271]|uniref:hypothetical protein n=1 Tax=Micromonospora sp. NPDC007271 TaxID=3154587 RepID=UPI0033C41F0B